MKNSPVQEDIGRKLPQKIFLPDQNRHKTKVKVDGAAHDHLEQKDSSHDDHHFLDDRCQTISKGEAIAILSHVHSPVRSESQVASGNS